ncbi:hypothetical protein A5906_26480 [Bradyrhizobium sacchari]|uniref:MazG-like nucleotide pyrophosphohydrolase family protein n=1 Tax=Bradyrhizobium sacchari TaxID=1399419 RepID=A0A560JYX5_9BRAD|nr:MazG nucleotide pyrophosphohydrolase domain-containing protein [Bradyrhizobium sacchari]OPY99271.1 hypothetical protein A5906_26480 [Bradyrhizobium sacchari]TWB62914.1 MazG-like nucleotide pyrophosphohydrolase family protein [Bradyrhizobium sacchari]TWB76156.1 MazG-like nucleotide pyrophosphohydrolase family protein [Bradyrhizobium sacchari]
MNIENYDHFVRTTTQFARKPREEMRSIALYGLVGEIGSVVAAIKKKILAEGGEEARWDQPNDEIKEELGDSLWYCYSISQSSSVTSRDRQRTRPRDCARCIAFPFAQLRIKRLPPSGAHQG